ncbi:MAG TPA: 30S ribosomal protein S6 [Candidatus Omnitrophota bacterium]|jgi:ribosomal protein S6|nr:MAG: 30S ribosomal protein S6 [Candidatus Omnitrophica bacterium ADurb.Bin314]HOE68576.1 30S ribosomal protein S6 [Candidatus Omnitrophota bacterium]HPW64566.1 30S ribosomal protein S6 [Candidatus Omnitrophota bacterium]HQB93602.1 30S ribosomal protein S6 [Candidatus Omnitrophota bacterium]
MRKYEGLFIFPTEATGETHKDGSAEVARWIEKFQGRVLQKTDLGKKTIGHPVGKHKDGKVLVVQFEMDPAKMQDFHKELEFQENLLKYMITVPDERKAKTPVAAAPVAQPVTPQT